jgi:hypothetical protein
MISQWSEAATEAYGQARHVDATQPDWPESGPSREANGAKIL